MIQLVSHRAPPVGLCYFMSLGLSESVGIRVEFYGIPRQRAGRASIEIEAANLGELMQQLAEALPEFAAACLIGANLRPGYLANVNGQTFTTDPGTPLGSGDAVLILSADAGG